MLIVYPISFGKDEHLMLVSVLLFLLGLILLIKGGDWFVDGATSLSRRFHIPELLIGATVVSIGTTLPEVMVSATSAIQGIGSFAYGNAIGSIICNTSLIAALTMAIAPCTCERKSLITPVCFFFGAAVIYCVASYGLKSFPRWIGIILLAIFAVYMILQVKAALSVQSLTPSENETVAAEETPLYKDILLLVVGAACIAIGAKLLVEHGQIIASGLGVPQSVIGLTFVALGTSLPELVTAITSLVKGHGALSLGNIIGANLFNLVLVSGLSITLSPFELPCEKTVFGGMNAALVIDLPLMLLVMLIMCVPALKNGRLKRWQGIVLLCIYAAFTAFQFIG